jgi:hypothetical protein
VRFTTPVPEEDVLFEAEPAVPPPDVLPHAQIETASTVAKTTDKILFFIASSFFEILAFAYYVLTLFRIPSIAFTVL